MTILNGMRVHFKRNLTILDRMTVQIGQIGCSKSMEQLSNLSVLGVQFKMEHLFKTAGMICYFVRNHCPISTESLFNLSGTACTI